MKKNSDNDNQTIDNENPPSPTEFMIPSIKEEIEYSPLEMVLSSILTLNSISLILIIFLFINFLNIFFFNKEIDLK